MNNQLKTDYWRWKEERWTDPHINPKDEKVIAAGVDVGSVVTQAVVMMDGRLFCYGNMRTGGNSPQSATDSMNWALEGTGLKLDHIDAIVGTGYGRINVPFATKAITEIACHARGANFIYGRKVRTILDMGGQDCKAIHCDSFGRVEAFLMNDKCAAGTGRGLEAFADLLGIHISQVGELSLQVETEPAAVSSTCVVFAKSEAAHLLRQGWPKEKVLAAYCRAMAQRVVELLGRLKVKKEFAITGGIAKNPGIVKRISQALGVEPLTPSMDTQLAGALGAALFAKSMFEKKSMRSKSQ